MDGSVGFAPRGSMRPSVRREAPTRNRLADTVVFVRGLSLPVTIGVSAAERLAPRTIRVDLELTTGHARADETDRLRDTVDYAAVVERVRSLVAGRTFKLLERLAGLIARTLLEEFPITTVRVRCEKYGMFPDVEATGVDILRQSPKRAST